jgi:predicted CoA-binding protein
MRYLQGQGYRTIPVNPFAAGATIHGERCHASLAEIPEPVDMVDVFRRTMPPRQSTRRSRSA